MYLTVRLFAMFVLNTLRIIDPFWGRMVGSAYTAVGLSARGVLSHPRSRVSSVRVRHLHAKHGDLGFTYESWVPGL